VKHNSYFGGAVQSLGFTHARGAASVGVMEPGSYEFSTGAPERMTIVSGDIEYRLPGEGWRAVAAGGEFCVPGEVKFDVRLTTPVAYVCWFG
jgi:uncharacterized protein YaiE (UPF0345 family)